MDIYTISFFGHRMLEQPLEIEIQLEELTTLLLTRNGYKIFLVGRNGVFDYLVSSTIQRTRRTRDWGNSSLVLVLPYLTSEYEKNQESFHKYYDAVDIYPESAKTHFKGAFRARNRYMIDQSDLVICYVKHESGGAFQAMQYAQKLGKPVINIALQTGGICPFTL